VVLLKLRPLRGILQSGDSILAPAVNALAFCDSYLLSYNQQQIQRIRSVIHDDIVIVMDIRDQCIISRLKFVSVPAVQDFVGQSEHEGWQTVLQVEDIEAHDAVNRAAVFFVILHDLLVPRDAFHFYLREEFFGQVGQFLGQVFADVPRVA
jgi:hypothetical protein